MPDDTNQDEKLRTLSDMLRQQSRELHVHIDSIRKNRLLTTAFADYCEEVRRQSNSLLEIAALYKVTAAPHETRGAGPRRKNFPLATARRRGDFAEADPQPGCSTEAHQAQQRR